MRAQEFVTDEINKQVFSPGWTDETTILNRYVLKARAADDWNKYQKLDIDVFDPESGIPYRIAHARFRIKPGFFFQKNLEASMIYVSQEYQKRGIATAIYQYVRKLGNTIKPSKFQLPAGKSMWKSFDRTDALAEETVPAQQVLQYVKQAHAPDEFNIEYSVTDHPEWQLTNIPLSQLKLDPDGEQQDPYSRVNWVDYDKVAELVPRIGSILKSMPIVVDAKGWIIDGNHRATAAAEAGLTSVPAYVPVQSVNEDIYDVLQPLDCGPFDGGCVLVAQALQQIHGGRVVVLVDADDRAQHAAVLADGKLIDYDGAADPKEFVQQFEQNERVRIQGIRPIRDTDLPDAPRDVNLIPQIVQALSENFADGMKPGRKGLSKRVGIPRKASLSQLQKIASNSTGERRRMAQWQLNMRRGKAKKNK